MDKTEGYEMIKSVYYSLQKNYGEARANRNKARHDGDIATLEYYKGECAAYGEAMHDINSIIWAFRIHDFVYSPR